MDAARADASRETLPTQLRLRAQRGAEVAESPTVSIIVLVMTDVSSLERCLRSLLTALPTGVTSEILVVANGTPRAVLGDLRARADITLIESPVNLGFAGGCNLAVRYARGENLLFLNDDVTVSRGWLEGLSHAMDEDARVAVVGSKVLLRDGRLQEAGSVLWSDGSTSGVGRGDDPGNEAYQVRRDVDYVSFCSALVRRCAWDAAGGFDERYFPAYYEDVDLCLTLQASGWRVKYEPSSVVDHGEGGSASRDFRDFISRRNQGKFVLKWSRTLGSFPPPPTEAERGKATEHALLLSAQRQASLPAPQPAADRSRTENEADLDDQATLRLIVDKLYADSAVKADYIEVLEDRAANRTVKDVLRARISRRLRSMDAARKRRSPR